MTDFPPDLQPATYIRRTADLRRLVDRLKSQPLLAVDTESNSLYAYYERVCLVQMSTREHDYIIDPLAMDDMSPLGDLFADPAIEVVFHAAEYDIITLKRDFDFTFSTVFDTMLAARICGWDKFGLGSILAEQFGVYIDKKYQRADWSERPLSESQLLYAQMDTHYLPELRDRLVFELEKTGRLQEAREIFADLPGLMPAERHFDPDGFWRINQIQDLKRSQLPLVRELYLLRDELARRRNLPPFKVLSDQTLIELARLSPRRVEDLHAVRGVSSVIIRHYGQQIIEALARGRRAPIPRPPRPRHTVDPVVMERYEALHDWRKQRAVERGVESDVIIPRETMWILARRAPKTEDELNDIPGLGPWRREQYGAELLAVLRESSKGK